MHSRYAFNRANVGLKIDFVVLSSEIMTNRKNMGKLCENQEKTCQKRKKIFSLLLTRKKNCSIINS